MFLHFWIDLVRNSTWACWIAPCPPQTCVSGWCWGRGLCTSPAAYWSWDRVWVPWCPERACCALCDLWASLSETDKLLFEGHSGQIHKCPSYQRHTISMSHPLRVAVQGEGSLWCFFPSISCEDIHLCTVYCFTLSTLKTTLIYKYIEIFVRSVGLFELYLCNIPHVKALAFPWYAKKIWIFIVLLIMNKR